MSRLGVAWRSLVAVAGGALILLVPAIYNRYPLVYADDGTYVYSGFEGAVPIDRPITYGLFIRLASLRVSLWFVVIAQALLVSYLLFETARALLGERRTPFMALTLAAFATAFTSAGWITGQVMPDVFTAVTILSATLLLVAPNRSVPRLAILAGALIFSCMTHLSHGLIVLFVALAASLVYAIARLRRRPPLVSRRRLLLLWSLLVVAALALPALHFRFRGGFRASGGSHAFLMARLIDAGVLKEFLDENCSKPTTYHLCGFKDSLPQDGGGLLWVDTSPLYKAGGWLATEPEYRAIIRRALLTPRYLARYAGDSVKGTLRTLTYSAVGDGMNAQAPGYYAAIQITKKFPRESRAFRSSRQNTTDRSATGDLDFSVPNTISLFVLGFSWLALILVTVLGLTRRFAPPATGFLFGITAGIVGNAAVTASLSTPLARYHSRAVWLLPVALLVVFVKERRALAAAFWDSFLGRLVSQQPGPR